MTIAQCLSQRLKPVTARLGVSGLAAAAAAHARAGIAHVGAHRTANQADGGRRAQETGSDHQRNEAGDQAVLQCRIAALVPARAAEQFCEAHLLFTPKVGRSSGSHPAADTLAPEVLPSQAQRHATLKVSLKN